MNIRFVVDSACDVPLHYIKKYDMTVIPAFVNYNGESFADDGEGFDRHQYYDMLHKIHPIPTTSAPSVGLAAQLIVQALEKADHLVLVSVGSTFSGIHNAMRLALQGLPHDRVTMIDSQQLSMGAGWQAIIGAETAAKTGDVAATLKAIRSVQGNQTMYAGLATVEFLRRGGRVSWTQALAGSLLKIRPIIRVDQGMIDAVTRVRKHGQWIDAMVHLARAQVPLSRIALLHTNNEEDLVLLRERLADVLPNEVIEVLATPSIGTHTGPRAIGIATVREL